jgi:F0F1-type ATP synthase membrane subunit b/b'
MKVEHSEQEISQEEQAHLDKLRKMVQQAVVDGTLSEAAIQEIRTFVCV